MLNLIKKIYKLLFQRKVYIVIKGYTVDSVWESGTKASEVSYYINQICGNAYSHVEECQISK